MRLAVLRDAVVPSVVDRAGGAGTLILVFVILLVVVLAVLAVLLRR